MASWGLSVTAVALSLLAACGNKEPPLGSGEGAAAVTAKPHVLVLNADSLVIEGRHVQLSGAFAPEQVPYARCWAEAVASKEAARIVQSMMERAQNIQVTPTGGMDRYNREYADVSVDGADLALSLIRDGLAAKDGRKRFEWCEPMSKGDPRGPGLWSVFQLSPTRQAHQ